MYQLAITPPSTQPNGVIKDGSIFIPFSPDNTEYQQYLKWLAEGNTPEPADEN
jgi:hypothetical protein